MERARKRACTQMLYLSQQGDHGTTCYLMVVDGNELSLGTLWSVLSVPLTRHH